MLNFLAKFGVFGQHFVELACRLVESVLEDANGMLGGDVALVGVVNAAHGAMLLLDFLLRL